MDSVELQISGLDAVMRDLHSLPLRVEQHVLRDACDAAARVLDRGVRLEIAGLTLDVDAKETLLKSLLVERRKARRGEVRVSVAVLAGKRSSDGKEDAFFWRWVEYGTMPRYRGNRGKLRADGKYVYKSDKRTGFTGQMKMQPFLRPAFEGTSGEAMIEAAKVARSLADRALRRAARRAGP